MNIEPLETRKIQSLTRLTKETPDDLFITCASFEERCLGAIQRMESQFCDDLVLFQFTEPNDKREYNIHEMNTIFYSKKVSNQYHIIKVDHSRISMGAIDFHHLCQNKKWAEKPLRITFDITTFTKSLLLELLSYIERFLSIETLRFVYTVPEKYAHPEEGELSFGIKSCNIVPSFWGGWSPIKDDLLIVILGYEEMRVWSLINQFDANLNLLYLTNPGSKPEWNVNCQKYNERLLREMPDNGSIPALSPMATIQLFDELITPEFVKKYNIFISPMGTKPQIVGLFYYIVSHPDLPINLISTTPVEHNIPYYSWGIGDTYEFYSPKISQK